MTDDTLMRGAGIGGSGLASVRSSATPLLADSALRHLADTARARSDWAERALAADRWARAWLDSGIESTREVEVQASFLSRVFVDILGYEDQGSGVVPWSLKAEPSSDVDARRPDATLGIFRPEASLTRAVVELKDATTDLDAKQLSRRDRMSPVEQAFLYVSGYEEADFALVSNFARLRLYSKRFGRSRFIEFDLTRLDRSEDLAPLLGVCAPRMLVGSGSAPGALMNAINDEPPRHQSDITVKFYERYAEYRDDLVQHLVTSAASPGDPIQTAQKILDRVLFIAFAEDVGLLPENVLERTVEHARQSRSRSASKVWDELCYLFEDVDTGRPDFSPRINRFNGGLFASDSEIETAALPNELATKLAGLGEFNFKSELDVNILGHVFENSLADLEALREDLSAGEPIAGEVRKRLGVYYTPAWVTDFLVDQTIGRTLQESPVENMRKTITILDPACGSGAFLSAALSYLTDHARALAHEEQALGKADLLSSTYAEERARHYVDRLFGIDVLAESVEISKLSLWLQTATRTEPLDTIDTIVQGNFLVPEGHPQHWLDSPVGSVTQDGGFDVVIGNPPWGAEISYDLDPRLNELARGQFDSYELFIEHVMKTALIRGGILGFIIPDRLLRPEGERTRRFLFDNYRVMSVLKLGEGVFPGVSRASVVVIVRNEAPEAGDTYLGLIVTKSDRAKLELGGTDQLLALIDQRGGQVSTERVRSSPTYEMPLVADVDLRIVDRLRESASSWVGEDGIFADYGRGEELGRDTFTVQCPACFAWDVNPRKRAQSRGGGFEAKTCASCAHEFTVDEAAGQRLAMEDTPESDDLLPIYAGDAINRYRLGQPMGLRPSVPGISYKPQELFGGPKLLIRQTSLGIYTTIDYSDAHTLQSVYVYHLPARSEESLEWYLAQLASRTMLFYYFVHTNQVEWQSFPKLTHSSLHQLPLVRPDLSTDSGRRLHDEVRRVVRERMAIATVEVAAVTSRGIALDQEIETRVMDIYGLDQAQRARITERLRHGQELRIIRELYPPDDEVMDIDAATKQAYDHAVEDGHFADTTRWVRDTQRARRGKG